MKRTRIASWAAALGATLVFVLAGPSACNLVSGVDELSFDGQSCRLDGDCTPGENECRAAACIDGKCSLRVLPDGPAATQTPGDCKTSMCVAGKLVQVAADDVLLTATDCDKESCADGEQVNHPLPARTPCNTSGIQGVGLCDDQGQCVECLKDEDCPTSGDLCEAMVCESDRRCRSHFLAKDTPLPDQQKGDCRVRACDGAGNETFLPDDLDVPSDGNDCTDDACMAGQATHTPRAKDSTCGNGLLCDANGQCVGCNDDADCSPNQVCSPENVCLCEPSTCESLGATCGIYGNGCGEILDCNDGLKNGAERGVDCGGGPACAKCTNGTPCAGALDCQSGHCVDGVCCNDACDAPCQSCSAAGKGYPDDGACGYVHPGLDPDGDCADLPKVECSFSGTCDGAGACAKYENGTTCSQASCTGSVFNAASACGGGACDAAVPYDCSPYACTPEGCASSCTKDDDCTALGYCDGGLCKPKKKAGEACDEASACESGPCVDGYCCDTACTEACKACDVSNHIGTCWFVPQNMADITSCVAPSAACDGFGVCKKAQGQACTNNLDCAAGNCVDGVCCNSACGDSCRACNLPGSVGTCTVVPSGQTDGDLCKAPSACNGFGACSKGPAAPCAIGAECTSGYCFDGVCCNTECKAACMACNVMGTVGTCTNVPNGQTDPGTCPAPKHCNGMGVCQ